METILSYRNLIVTNSHLQFIKKLIAENPTDSRRKLSQKVCRHFNWVQQNGFLRDMVCRSLLLKLAQIGHITLPQPRGIPPQLRCLKEKSKYFCDDILPMHCPITTIFPLSIELVRYTENDALYKHLINQYHYLGYTQPVGEHLKYIIYYAQRPIACIAFSSAPRHIGSRDRFIGWDQNTRRRNINLLAYNTRFLILPWVSIPHLASHILGVIARRISKDWQQHYNHPIYFLETFVDTERFAGTCYKAANWRYLGLTTGRGKNDHTHKVNRSIKAIWGYPLVKDFQEKLCHE